MNHIQGSFFYNTGMKLLKVTAYTTLAGIGLVLSIFVVARFQQETQSIDEKTCAQAPGLFMQLAGGKTHYQLLGNKENDLLVLIHGGGITGMEVWNTNASFLALQGYQVLVYDLYGRGYSDRIAGDYTPELLLNQLNELIKALNLRDSMSVISMSMGSIVALDFATQHPDKVKSLVMIDPAIMGDYRANPLLKIPIVSDLLMTLYWYPRAVENQRKEFVDQKLFDTYKIRLEYFMNFKGYKAMNHSTWLYTLTQNKSELLRQIFPNKIQLIYGDHDPYFSNITATKLQALYPTLEQKVIAGAGHMPHFEKPDIVNPLVLDFLKSTSYQSTIKKPE